MQAFWLSMVMIFLAELGDKTQLVALTLATRYNARIVLWGIFWATFGVHIASTAIGWVMGGILPTDWIKFFAGLAFIAFGFWTLRGDSLDDDEEVKTKITSPFWLVFVTFFLAELGDKTMLSTVTLATTNAFIPVWFGSTLGMVLSDGLAIWIGTMLGTRLPEKTVKLGASVIFFAFGVFSMIQGGLHLPAWVWLIAAVTCIALGIFFLRPTQEKAESNEERMAS